MYFEHTLLWLGAFDLHVIGSGAVTPIGLESSLGGFRKGVAAPRVIVAIWSLKAGHRRL